MATTIVYRCQPIGLDLGDHRSETSNEELDRGVHVCGSLEELYGAVRGWCSQDWQPEVIAIECEEKHVAENGDYEGSVLVGNRGKIVSRTAYESWDAFAVFVRDYFRGE